MSAQNIMFELVIGLIIGIVGIAICLIIAGMQPASSAIKSKPKRLQSFTSAIDPQETLKAVVRFAQQAGYKIPIIDETKGLLVLEESATVTTWGFFFPVFVSQQPDNTTLVEVGIKSKLVHYASIESRNHDKCVNGIKAALFAQSA